MKLSFYGVRGSIATPIQCNLRYGGNTSCLYLQPNDNGQGYILDAGTGIRILGHKLIQEEGDINILLSHTHWDHIQGFPFFLPIYQEGRSINIYTPRIKGKQSEAVLRQMSGQLFPVRYNTLAANVQIKDYEQIIEECTQSGIRLSVQELNHTGSGYGMRFEKDGVIVIYITDNELCPPYDPPISTWDEWVAFVRNADLLVHDAQYLEEDLEIKRGWGHTTVKEAAQLAREAEVKNLALFHHDPDRSDGEVDNLLELAKKELQSSKVNCLCAQEGLTIHVTSHGIECMFDDK